MARIRSIKPEVRISEKVNSWPIECRYFWVLLWGFCDDYGYGRDNARLIVADTFPLDDSISAETVQDWMDTLWNAGVIERFKVGDSAYFQVINWEEHQKISHPAKQILPTIQEATEVLQRITVIPREVTGVSEKTSPKQGAGSREQGAGICPPEVDVSRAKSPYTAAFDSWWVYYPRKESKGDAFKAWESARKKRELPTPADLIAATEQYKRRMQSKDPEFVKLPAGWLRDRKWEDEDLTAVTDSWAGYMIEGS
jgi:hypothetical protein